MCLSQVSKHSSYFRVVCCAFWNVVLSQHMYVCMYVCIQGSAAGCPFCESGVLLGAGLACFWGSFPPGLSLSSVPVRSGFAMAASATDCTGFKNSATNKIPAAVKPPGWCPSLRLLSRAAQLLGIVTAARFATALSVSALICRNPEQTLQDAALLSGLRTMSCQWRQRAGDAQLVPALLWAHNLSDLQPQPPRCQPSRGSGPPNSLLHKQPGLTLARIRLQPLAKQLFRMQRYTSSTS